MYLYHIASITNFVEMIESETLSASKQIGGISAVSLTQDSRYVHPYIAKYGWVRMHLSKKLLRADYNMTPYIADEIHVQGDIYPLLEYLKSVEVYYATRQEYVGDEDVDSLIALNTEIIPLLQDQNITVRVPKESLRLQPA